MKLITTIHDIASLGKLSHADGFVLGNAQFSARVKTIDDLTALIEAIHLIYKQKKQVFLLMNQMMADQDLNAAKSFLQKLPLEKVTGIIIADIGMISVLSDLNIENKAVYHPETLLTNYHDFNALYDQNILGAFVSKEITLKDIETIGKHKKYQLFMFGHGHLSMFYSKRRIMDAYQTHTQTDLDVTLKNNFSISEEKRKDEDFPIYQDKSGLHIFRGHIFTTIGDIDIISKHVDCLMIDTLFHDDDYACEVLRMYQQKHLDYALDIQQRYHETWYDGFLHKKTFYKGNSHD